MDNPLSAPSTSPISMAFAVPDAWLVVPIATPFATGFFILNKFNILGPKIAPKTPLKEMDIDTIAPKPPICYVKGIAIAVVID